MKQYEAAATYDQCSAYYEYYLIPNEISDKAKFRSIPIEKKCATTVEAIGKIQTVIFTKIRIYE